MQTIKFKRLAKPQILTRICRPLLGRFFEHFKEDFNALALPPPDLAGDDCFRGLAGLLMSPAGLPDRLNEALFAIDDLGSPQGHEALETAPEWAAKRSLLEPGSTREEIPMQLWLAAPDWVARVHNGLRLKRLTAFEHAGRGGSTKFQAPTSREIPSFKPQGGAEPNSPLSTPLPFGRGGGEAPDRMTMLALATDLDAWFAANDRGVETTRIEIYPLEGELWFLIRHGDLFTRAPKVEQQNTEILHFRPERDDVVVYAPALDELRVNARTKGERDLYFQQFGRHLRGRADYFSERNTYTLEPLRTHGLDALDAREIAGIRKIRLRELEVTSDNGRQEIITRADQGLFEFAASIPDGPEPIPRHGRLARAIFEVQFTGSVRCHPVEIRLPNVLKVGRRCDGGLVRDWLAASGFWMGGVRREGARGVGEPVSG